MSRIGSIPIKIPDGIDVKVDGSKVTVSKGNESLEHIMNEGITARVEDGEIIVDRPDDERESKALHGLNRSLINNMVQGLKEG